ncbi:efflux RND transporter periplasmic adaptor subunit [Actomonas aquatica]|uniref:Efflux RND transporter periplasmic adaptor subunit n=1 Tax=Actomonas aquatica TaxID=2866162 RepID=A0ABZ1CA07_9BACT|nr:efflux RND transporter periplasmic adaptor subunit [Opitutus sp. WL0086]WRQ88480.1 efflux RND transporter periplasmic adaptor subunit [Opitutus sp. WL0086]
MKKFIAVLVVVVAGVAAAVMLNRPTATVRAAWQGKALQSVPGSVTVQAEYDMALKSEVGGRVQDSALDTGASFAEGDFLVQIDSSDLELEIERIQTEYDAAKARIELGSTIALELETAQERLAEDKRLLDSGNFSQSEYRKRERAVQQIENKLKTEEVNNDLLLASYRNTLAQRRRQLAKMRITAPFDCVVSEVYARPGDLIGSNSPIALLISTSRTVEARISEENFSNIALGQRASVRLLGYGNQQFNATVSKVLPAADAETQRYIVHLNVDIPLDQLVPGLTGEVSIITNERDGTTLIPRRALIGDKVMVVSDGVVEIRSVEAGYESLNEVEIVSGISPGELVITEELDLYRDGDRVNVEERG